MALYTCPFCKRRYLNKDALYIHMDKNHHDDLNGLSAKQVYFNYSNKYALTKGFGRSVISGKPTKFNEITGRYERFLPEEKDAYREYFIANMKKAGKEDIMKDMDHQKEMLAARGISGSYKWSDGTVFTYTGSYEKKFLEYLDTFLNWPSSDLMAPAPQLFSYIDSDGVEHEHIPDFYISSLNLIINIKGGSNQGYRLRDIDIEKREDAAIEKSSFNYIKLYDTNFADFPKYIDQLKDNQANNKRTLIESVSIENDDFKDLLD
jgi:hypothetical protein